MERPAVADQPYSASRNSQFRMELFLLGHAEVKATVFGAAAAKTIRTALKQILLKVQEPDFNCLEVTKIVERRFLGMPYITVSTCSRHIQQGYLMERPDQRRNFQNCLTAI